MTNTAVKPKLKTVGVDHVVLHVSDLARSRKFYTELLGMEVNHESSWQSFLWCGKQQIALFEMRDGSPVPTGELNHMALRLESGSYEEVKATLENAGFPVSGRRGDDRCIYFTDPDGHRLQVLTPDEQ